MPQLNMTVSIRIDTSPLDALSAGLPARADGVLAEGCAKIESDIKISIQQQHIIDTGNLFNSIHFEKLGMLSYLVADRTDYGIYQELGTRFFPARPFFVPSVEKNVDPIVSAMAGIFK